DVDRALAQERDRSEDGRRARRDFVAYLFVHVEGDVDLIAREIDALDAADLFPRDTHRRPDGEPGHVRESRLERVALPEKAARAGEAEDHDGRDDDRDDRD